MSAAHAREGAVGEGLQDDRRCRWAAEFARDRKDDFTPTPAEAARIARGRELLGAERDNDDLR